MGATAIERLLGPGAGTVEHLHGKPIEVIIAGRTRIILPSYHPAAALHDTAKLRQCVDDFKVLRGLAKGIPASEYQIVDEYPNPVYQVADTDAKLKQMRDEIESAGEFAIDTETCRGKLWSVQISTKPGTAWFILADKLPPQYWDRDRIDLRSFNALAVIHNYLFDVQYLSVRDNGFVDSMVMAYLSGQAQGLKELASRLCGIAMRNYSEVVHVGQQKISLSYLTKASKKQWSDPPAIEETKWDNKQGRLVTKAKKPWHISRKISKIITDSQADDEIDLYDRWKQIPVEERAEVESVLGIMPESSLMDIPFAESVRYGSRDADATLRVYHKLQKLVDDLDLNFVLNVDTGVLPEVYDMMRNGMPVDLPYLQGLSVYYGVGMVSAAERCANIAGHAFNPSSSLQVATVVYQELGFKPTKKTATGLICTDDQELKKVNHPVIKEILEYRRLLKNKSTFADALSENAVPHQQGNDLVYRVHTTLKTTRTETGRLSSADPINLQTMPTRSEEGKKIRKGFHASPGCRFLAGDFSQQELRLQAHEAKCKNLLELYRNNVDVHTATAARIFGVSMEDAQKSRYRYPAKTLNFSIIYLVSAKGLNESIHEQALDIIVDGKPMDVSEWDEVSCQKLINDWYKLNPEVREWQMEKVAEARRFGFVKDIFGRLRFVPEVSCPIKTIRETGERMCVNFPIQGGCATITKLAMIETWNSRNRIYSPEDVCFIMAIHDELMLEVKEELVMEAAKWLKHIMDNVVTLAIPMISEMKSGESWGDMEKIKL
jgi:DNA polymerase I-like protein with 3'-5' exonuclease and polymerase domains